MNGRAYPSDYRDVYVTDRARARVYGEDRVKAQQQTFSDLTRIADTPVATTSDMHTSTVEKHSPLRVLAAIFTFLCVCLLLVFDIMAATDYGREVGLFTNASWNASNTVQINSKRVVFYMSFINCGISLLWVIYALSTVCRSTQVGPLYVYPSPMPLSLYPLVSVSCGLLIGWRMLWDRLQPELACLLSFLASVFLHLAQAVSAKHLDRVKKLLIKYNCCADYWLTQALVLNGLAFSAGLYIIVAHIDLALVLSYGKLTSMKPEDSSRVSLSCMSVLLLVHSVLDFFYLDRWTRYTITPYLPVAAVLIGACVKNWALEDVTVIFAAALLCTCLIGFCIKMIFVVARHIRDNPTRKA